MVIKDYDNKYRREYKKDNVHDNIKFFKYMWKIGLETLNPLYLLLRKIPNISFLENINKLKNRSNKNEIEAAELFF